MAQAAECLLSKCKVLRSNPSAAKGKKSQITNYFPCFKNVKVYLFLMRYYWFYPTWLIAIKRRHFKWSNQWDTDLWSQVGSMGSPYASLLYMDVVTSYVSPENKWDQCIWLWSWWPPYIDWYLKWKTQGLCTLLCLFCLTNKLSWCLPWYVRKFFFFLKSQIWCPQVR
jgi:hypothetical protein